MTKIVYRAIIEHAHMTIDDLNRRIGPDLLISEARTQIDKDLQNTFDRLMTHQNEVSKILIFLHKNNSPVVIGSIISIFDGRCRFKVEAIEHRHSHVHQMMINVFILRRLYI